jgi:hypothetical protein
MSGAMATRYKAPRHDDSSGRAEALAWRRSSWCATQSCLEVADLADGGMAVRDSKSTPESGVTLVFTADEWTSFILGVKAGEFG